MEESPRFFLQVVHLCTIHFCSEGNLQLAIIFPNCKKARMKIIRVDREIPIALPL